jgi:hydroxypyruvate isomerase
MLRFTANLSLLFTELPLIERFRAAKYCGFDAVEIQFPYELPAEAIQAELQSHDLKLVLFNVAADTLLQGGEGLAAVPEKQAQFKLAIEQAVTYAQMLKPDVINVLPGCCFSPQRLHEYLHTLKTNLRYAAETFADIGVTTVFEAINSHDMPGFIVDKSSQMLALLEDVNHPQLKLQYDIYHMQRMQEDSAAVLKQCIDKIGHIQFADCPGRGQPGTGAIDFELLFGLIANLPYQGWVGAEYKPVAATLESLGWMKSWSAKFTTTL